MAPPISFTVRPPSSAPHRPSPLGNGGGRSGPPSRRFFEQSNGDEDEDDDNDDARYRSERRDRPREEKIDGFGRNGKATGTQKAEGPMVIPALPNRDWRQVAARRTPSYRPEEQKREEETDNKPDRMNDEPQRSGLRYMVKKEIVEDTVDGVQVKQEQEDAVDIHGNGNGTSTTTTTSSTTTKVKTEPVDAVDPPKPMTLEEQALQAILSADQSIESDADRLQREMIIMTAADRQIQAPSEADALQRDLDALPEISTGDDYRNVPVEAFGMAMLRGMGWNPNDESNTKIHIPKARPGQLGLGATPMSDIIPPSHDKKSKREDRAKRGGRGFNASGVMLKREINGGGSASGSRSETPAESSRRTSPETESDSSRRRRRDDDYDSGRESKRREGDRDRDRDRDRYRETEEERARRKAKERERDRDYDRDRNRDRDRRSNGDRDKDRYSDKDRDDDKDRRDKYDDRDRRDRHRDDRDRR